MNLVSLYPLHLRAVIRNIRYCPKIMCKKIGNKRSFFTFIDSLNILWKLTKTFGLLPVSQYTCSDIPRTCGIHVLFPCRFAKVAIRAFWMKLYKGWFLMQCLILRDGWARFLWKEKYFDAFRLFGSALITSSLTISTNAKLPQLVEWSHTIS